MPPADLADLIRVLPTWVVVGAWVATPLLLLVTGVFSVWLVARCARVSIDGLHWTEAARLRTASRSLLARHVFVQVVLAAAVALITANGEITASAPSVRALAAAFVTWLATRPIVLRHLRSTQPDLTAREFWNGQVVVLVLFTVPLLAVVMALAGPRPRHDNVAWCVGFYTLGLALMWWLARRGMVAIARAARLIEAANARLRALVADVERRTGHTIRRAWILRAPWANAAAFPPTNELLVTTRALELMNDAELTAVLLHEVGHLRESRADSRRRGLGLLPFVVLALWQPLSSAVGWVAAVVALLGSLVVLRLTTAHTKRLEEAADRHVHEHMHEDAGAYARTLERLHCINLMPAVASGRRQTHPHLYDRMLAAGVQPDYPRPLPPPRWKKLSAALLFVAFVPLVASAAPRFVTRTGVYESERMAFLDVVLGGGDHIALGAVGWHWMDARPADAATVLSFVANRSDLPEHSAWLAMTLANTDPKAARESLARAESLLERRPGDASWLRDTIDAARERLDAADLHEHR